MVTEKNNFSSNAQHNFAKGKVISECKNGKPRENLIGKIPAHPPPPPHPFQEYLPLQHVPSPIF